MANYNSIEDIITNVENATQLVNNTKYDDITYSITDLPEWVKYKGQTIASIVASGNSWVGFGAGTEHLKVNRRNTAMYNLWYEQGIVKNIPFIRIRWSGYSTYNNTSSSYLLAYDIIMLENGDIVLYMADIPTSNYTGTFTFDGVTYTKPTTDKKYVSFRIQADNTYIAEYECIQLYILKYLIESNNVLYTVENNVLVELTGPITASLFQTRGADLIPSGTLLMGLENPKVFCWTDGDFTPQLTATVQGQPQGEHTIISNDINVGHESIYGLLSLEVNASDECSFFVNFDGGEWMVYNSSSNAWEVSSVGMNALEFQNVPINAWDSAIVNATTMKLKVALDGVDTITQIKFNFNNESPLG